MVSEIRMTTAYRPLVSLVVSLVLMMAAPAMTLAKMPGGRTSHPAVTAIADCGSQIMTSVKTAGTPFNAGGDCATMPDITCAGAAGLGSCSVIGVGLLPAAPKKQINIGSQPIGFLSIEAQESAHSAATARG